MGDDWYLLVFIPTSPFSGTWRVPCVLAQRTSVPHGAGQRTGLNFVCAAASLADDLRLSAIVDADEDDRVIRLCAIFFSAGWNDSMCCSQDQGVGELLNLVATGELSPLCEGSCTKRAHWPAGVPLTEMRSISQGDSSSSSHVQQRQCRLLPELSAAVMAEASTLFAVFELRGAAPTQTLRRGSRTDYARQCLPLAAAYERLMGCDGTAVERLTKEQLQSAARRFVWDSLSEEASTGVNATLCKQLLCDCGMQYVSCEFWRPAAPSSSALVSACTVTGKRQQKAGSSSSNHRGVPPPMAVTRCIPVGGDCACATALRRAGLRQRSEPFDWIRSTPAAVAKLLRSAFRHLRTEGEVEALSSSANCGSSGDGNFAESDVEPAPANTFPRELSIFEGFGTVNDTTMRVVHVARDSNEYLVAPLETDGAEHNADRQRNFTSEHFIVDSRFGLLSTAAEVADAVRRWERHVSELMLPVYRLSISRRQEGGVILIVHIARTAPHTMVVPDEVCLNGSTLLSEIARRDREGCTAAVRQALHCDEAVPTLTWTRQRWEDLRCLTEAYASTPAAAQQRLTVLCLVFNLWPFDCVEGSLRNVALSSALGNGEDVAAAAADWLMQHVALATS